MFGATLLWVMCAAFAAFGIGFVAAPVELAELFFDAAPTAPSGLIDMRATYGGLSIGAAIFFGLCAGRREWQRPGLLAAIFVMAGLAAGRVVGLFADGDPNGFMWLFLALEVGAVGLVTMALRELESSAAVRSERLSRKLATRR